jgi:AcrR family transcriptional regulator
LTIGYEKTSIRLLEKNTGVNYGSIMYAFESKENLVSSLVEIVLETQFEFARELIKSKTNDKLLIYVAETVLQLYLAEASEHMREMYNVSYSLPSSTKKVHNAITSKLEDIFKEQFPDYTTKDFYYLELGAAGIMRSYMNRKCDMFFTMDTKVEKFIEVLLLIYRVPNDRINEAIEFVKEIDFKELVPKFIDELEKKFDEKLA